MYQQTREPVTQVRGEEWYGGAPLPVPRAVSRRVVLAAAATALTPGAIAACGIGGAGGPNPPQKAAGSVTFGLTKGTPDQVVVMERMVAGFQQSHPAIKVTPEYLYGQGAPTLDARRAAGDLPDIWGLPSYLGGLPWAHDGVLMALDGLVKQDRTFKLDEFSARPVETFRMGGKLWGLPQLPNPVVIYVNRSHLQKNGIPLPTDDWTIDQFVDVTKRATRGIDSGEGAVWGYDYARRWSLFMGWLPLWGASMTNADRTQFAMDKPEAIAALEWDTDLMYRRRAGPPPTGASTTGLGANIPGADFQKGTAAFTCTGIVDAPRMRQSIGDAFEWDILAQPKGPKGRGATLSADGWWMKKDTRVAQAAWELLKMIVGEEHQRAQMQAASVFPSLKKLVPEFAKLAGIRNGNAASLTVEQLGVPFPVTPSINKWTGEILAPALTAVWQRKQNAKDAMASIASQVNAVLAEDAKRPLLG